MTERTPITTPTVPGGLPFDATQIQFTQSGTGAVARTVQSKERDVVSVFDFMTAAQVADAQAFSGTLDLTTAIQNALSASVSGGIIFFPPGLYKVTSAIAITSGITLRGASNVDNVYGGGPGTYKSSFIYQATAATHLFTIGSKVWDVNMSDLTLSAVAPASLPGSAQASKYGIKMEDIAANGSSYRMTFKNITFNNFDRAIHVADAAYEAVSGTPTDWEIDRVLVERCNFFNNNRGIYFNTINADEWHVLDCVFVAPTNGFGIYWKRIGTFLAVECDGVPMSAATGTELFRLAGFNSATIKLDHCTGSDALGYFLHVDNSAYTISFNNVDKAIKIDTCQVESALLIESQRHIISVGTTYAASNPQCSGASCQVESYSDSFASPATGWNMSGTLPNFNQFPSKGSSTAGVLNNTATTIFAVLDTATPVMYQVFAMILDANNAIYHAHAVLTYDGTLLVRLSGTNGANLTITVSGANVQVTQTSGVTQTIHWGYQRVG